MSLATARIKRLFLEPLEDRCLLSGITLGTEQLPSAYGQIPLSFEANQGQTNPQVNFLSRGNGYTLFLTPAEAVLNLQKPIDKPALADIRSTVHSPAAGATVLEMQLVGANPTAQVRGLDQLASTTNSFVGNDPGQWHANIPNYGRVEYQDVYPGVNLIYYGNQRQLEYDFVVAPGADPGVITLAFLGTQGITLDPSGDLVLHTSGGDVLEHAPVLYQESSGLRQAVSGSYVLEDNDQVRFAVDAYDASSPLIIDPVLSYSTYLGGSRGDLGSAIAVDSAGYAYIVGATSSADFPKVNPVQKEFYGGNSGIFDFGPPISTNTDAFVAKLNPSGTALVYSTYLGGTGTDFGFGIAVDAAGNAYVTGLTQSIVSSPPYEFAFPTTANSFHPASTNPNDQHNGDDAFVAKLNPSGSALVYSTFLGGDQPVGMGIAVDASGNAYVACPDWGGNFVAKLNAAGSALVYSHAGLGGTAIAVDASGDAYVTSGSSVAELDPTGSTLLYSNNLSGSQINGIAVDASGSAYVTGFPSSPDFPTTPGAFQTTPGGAFATKLNPAGSGLVYSTYLPGGGNSIAVDGAGDAYVTGSGVFVGKLNPAGSALLFSTYLGGSSGADVGNGIAVDGYGNAYVTGYTLSTDFPTTPGAFQTGTAGGINIPMDAFVAKIATTLPTVTRVTTSVNPSVLGQIVSLTATIQPASSGSGIPTGSVNFFDTSTNTDLGTVSLSNGSAILTISALAVGSHVIQVSYGGDSLFLLSSVTLVESVHYSFSGFLPPLNQNIAFGLNRTIPIKWQLTNFNGTGITSLSAITSLQVAPVLSGGGLGTPFNPTPSGGTALRNDGSQYIFNWQTKGLAAGNYEILLTLADGTVKTKVLQLSANGSGGALLVDATNGSTTAVGALLGGNIDLYVDNSNGDLTVDELARIQDAVTAVDAVTVPYGVTVTEVTDPSQADVTLNMDATSAVGSYSTGVLGCTTDAGQITIIAGWNFYAGSDTTQIGSAQYDFETVVIHELGHALGLGHSANSASVMFATLNPGTTNRALAVADLNVPDSDTGGACGLHAENVGRISNPSYGSFLFAPPAASDPLPTTTGYQEQPDFPTAQQAALNTVLADWNSPTDFAGQVARILDDEPNKTLLRRIGQPSIDEQDDFWSTIGGEPMLDQIVSSTGDPARP